MAIRAIYLLDIMSRRSCDAFRSASFFMDASRSSARLHDNETIFTGTVIATKCQITLNLLVYLLRVAESEWGRMG